jgi:hypothetical protein
MEGLFIAEPFSVMVSFSAMWLMRWADPRFGYLLMASSGLLAITFYAQSFLVLGQERPQPCDNVWLVPVMPAFLEQVRADEVWQSLLLYFPKFRDIGFGQAALLRCHA